MTSEKIQTYFKEYPASTQCFEAADGMVFHEEGDAGMHQSGTLKIKEPVKKHYRPVVSALKDDVVQEDVLVGSEEDAGIVDAEPQKTPAKKRPVNSK